MPSYKLIPAAAHWDRYCEIYNRATVFAPYTLPLDENVVKLRLDPFYQNHRSFCAIGLGEREEGILHASIYSGEEDVLGDKPPVGIIHLLFADKTSIAAWLLTQVEAWFCEWGATAIHTCTWHLNPYQYILHGAETFIWGGAYPAVNAFHRLGYDLELDTVFMSLEMPAEPEPYWPDLPGFEISDIPGQEDFFAATGVLRALVDGKQVGECGYQFLRAISGHLHKNIGQFYISCDSNLHGQGIGRALLTHAHHNLYHLGVRRVILTTNQGLFRAIKFYEKLGYRTEAVQGYWFSKSLDG
jgi:GNAT superfamily N-acetyltransferase